MSTFGTFRFCLLVASCSAAISRPGVRGCLRGARSTSSSLSSLSSSFLHRSSLAKTRAMPPLRRITPRYEASDSVAVAPKPVDNTADLRSLNPSQKPQDWAVVSSFLRDRDVKPMKAKEILEKMEDGSISDVTMVDISTSVRFGRYHIPGSVNVPMFRLIKNWDAKSVLRRMNYALFMDFQGTERDPDFFDNFKAKFPPPHKGQTVVIVDDSEYGTLQGTTNFPNGRISRSLLGISELYAEGYECDFVFMQDSLGAYLRHGGQLVDADGAEVSKFAFEMQDMLMR